ncbi:protein amalgam isoform X2 [Lingula anatina]|uniref:Protein amalgam isoform X2 n=1 Tax=Lingula anatina TaxID=7574 RepID=A0A1S3JDR9_LINAN|nr:protein amalgam isoform X2 [Lingula anatina]|eukprot:XP_013408316.1 protein amalgam isoform X2 [Lingula anatina]
MSVLFPSMNNMHFNQCNRIITSLVTVLCTLLSTVYGRPNLLPSFDTPQVNVTVIENKDAMLPCSVNHLGELTVLWQGPQGEVLTLNDRRVIDTHRFSIVRPYLRDWNLHIDEVKLSDQGSYTCSIGPQPVLAKVVNLHVKVPAEIVSNRSSPTFQKVKEGDTVILTCNVTGQPTPKVNWYRRGAKESDDKKETASVSRLSTSRGRLPEVVGLDGEVMIIHNISRYCDDVYECQAYNGVASSVSRLMRVVVEFPPEVRLPNPRIGQSVGKDTILECIITAEPIVTIYWMYRNTEIQRSTRYDVEAYDEGPKTVILTVRIFDLTKEDFGEYTCVAKNKLGMVKKSMTVFEYIDTKEVDSTTATPHYTIKGKEPENTATEVEVMKPSNDDPEATSFTRTSTNGYSNPKNERPGVIGSVSDKGQKGQASTVSTTIPLLCLTTMLTALLQ